MRNGAGSPCILFESIQLRAMLMHLILALFLLTLTLLPVAAQEQTPATRTPAAAQEQMPVEQTPVAQTPTAQMPTAQTPVAVPPIIAPDPARYRLHPLAAGLNRPVYLTHAGDGSGRLFLLEQPGLIQVFVDDVLQPQPFLDMTAHVSRDSLRQFSERGLLGLAFDPDFASNGRFFVHYSDHDGNTVLARLIVDPDASTAVETSPRQIILLVPQPYGNHNGGQIAFGPDGYLYFGLGDGGSAGDPLNNGQNPATLLGSILRLDVEVEDGYAIPPDNPGLVRNLLLAPQIWAWGLRNPWRFSFDRVTGELYIADVGQVRREEVNVQPADSQGGINYGWRVMEGSLPYSGGRVTPDMQAPAFEYSHDVSCSITGGYVYRGAALPELRGIYFYGDWCSGNLWAAWRDPDGVWQNLLFSATGMQISSFGEDEDGELYVLDLLGVLYRLARA